MKKTLYQVSWSENFVVGVMAEDTDDAIREANEYILKKKNDAFCGMSIVEVKSLSKDEENTEEPSYD